MEIKFFISYSCKYNTEYIYDYVKYCGKRVKFSLKLFSNNY